MSGAILEVRDLCKYFPMGKSGWRGAGQEWLKAVDGVSFDLHPGQTLGLVGESGCGKSTCARTIVGLYPPTAGTIRFNGNDLGSLSPRGWAPYRRKIQMIFQDPFASLDPRQTVGSILTEPMAIHKLGKPRDRRLRSMQLLEAVGLNPRHLYRYPHEFSGGQRQRIGIARALALEPEVIICDEPVSALDVSIQAQVINLLGELQQQFNLAYLFIAHDLAVVRHICHRVAVMYLGRVVEVADRDTLFANPSHPYTRSLLSAVPHVDPEVESVRQRIVLRGDVPSPLDPPSGCTFHPRCPERDQVSGDRCSVEVPILQGSGSGDQQRTCHLDT
ncbi:MAG TPA: ATP-binding cassette domain-containing protein [Planctomycetes bacterium]|nr:ATP-binding cassette domain-containing protein [Planctomycetota bacterium]